MLVADDEYYIRFGIANVIDWASIDIEIVGEAENGIQALELAKQTQPDLILLDICMPLQNGLELMKQLREEHLDCGIIILSGYDEFEYAQQCFQYGVLDYLLKPIDKQKLKDTVVKACLTRRNQRSLQNYQHFVQQEHPSLCNQFLQNLLLGHLDDTKKIKEKIDFLHIPILEGCYQVLYIRLDDYNLLESQLTLDELRWLKEQLQTHLESCFSLSKSFMGTFTQLSADEWGVLLSFTAASAAEDQDKQLHACVDLFFSKLETATTHTVSISISPMSKELTDLPELYQNARRSNRKFIPCKNSVIWPGNAASQVSRSEIQGILNFVFNHYSEPITIQQVADALYISPSYLMHLFKSCTGKTFNTFLMEYRMEKAMELLQTSGIQIQAVAQAVGYSDVKYFNKLFKKHTSLTPSEYIKIHYAKS